MEKMIGYIFGSLKNTDEAIIEINKSLRYQVKINKRFGLYSLATVAWLYFAEKRYAEEKKELKRKLEMQNDDILRLKAEVIGLKKLKGEHKM